MCGIPEKGSESAAGVILPGYQRIRCRAGEIFKDRNEYAPLIKRDPIQATSIFIEFTDLNIVGDGRIAWVTSGCNCTFVAEGKDKQMMRVRMTIGLRNTGNRWLIEQLHISTPNTGQAPGQSFSGE
ncbi:MAG: nuclear transport factor 2 family protein [Proteobacteria bacterium]|nr:nuclear transport factor 2 family protein [Pseudomonadota bacterium]